MGVAFAVAGLVLFYTIVTTIPQEVCRCWTFGSDRSVTQAWKKYETLGDYCTAAFYYTHPVTIFQHIGSIRIKKANR